MIALRTGSTHLDFDGPDRLILSVPSGCDVVQITMNHHQARMMVERGRFDLDEQNRIEQATRSAEIIPLKTPRRKGAGRAAAPRQGALR